MSWNPCGRREKGTLLNPHVLSSRLTTLFVLAAV